MWYANDLLSVSLSLSSCDILLDDMFADLQQLLDGLFTKEQWYFIFITNTTPTLFLLSKACMWEFIHYTCALFSVYVAVVNATTH